MSDELQCPRCGCEDFSDAVEFCDDILVHRDVCNECDLAFDGEEWKDSDGKVFELAAGT